MSKSLILCVSACALLLGCAPERPSDQGRAERTQDEAGLQPVAIVNGETITLDDFQRRLDGVAPYARPRYATQEKRAELLESMVVMELLADEAERDGLGEHPAVVQAMRETMSRLVLQDRLRKRVELKDITDAEIKAYYEVHRDEFARPEQRKLFAIAGDSREQVEAWRNQMLTSPTLDDKFKAFRKLAATSSRDATSRRGAGDIGYHESPRSTRKKMAFSLAGFRLKQVGQISEPFQDGGLWWMVMLAERKASEIRPLSDVTSKIRTILYDKLRDKTREAYLKELREKATVETFDDVLQQAQAPRGSKLPELTPKLWRPSTRDLNKTPSPGRTP